MNQNAPLLRLPETHVDRQARFPAVLLFGMPGVGKGTQGTLLGTMNGMFHVSTGAIFRELDETSEDGRIVAEYIHHGELVPDQVSVNIWRHWIDREVEEGRYHPGHEVLILDGIPRTVEQCRLLEDHIDVLCVIHLEAESDEPIVERLKGRGQKDGRIDDADEKIIRKRIQIYRRTTAPVLQYYPSDRVHRVNPLGTQMEIKKRILELIIPAIRMHERAS